MDLYLLNHTNTKEYDLDSDSDHDCLRPYVVQPVELTNMLLIVIDTVCVDTKAARLKIIPTEAKPLNFTKPLACKKALETLGRKRPQSCVRSHRNESEIRDQCGLAANFQSNLLLTLVSLLLPCYQFKSIYL